MAKGSIKRTSHVETVRLVANHGTIGAGAASTVTMDTGIPYDVDNNACVVGSFMVSGNYNSNINVWAAYVSKDTGAQKNQLVSRIRNSGSSQAGPIEVHYTIMYAT